MSEDITVKLDFSIDPNDLIAQYSASICVFGSGADTEQGLSSVDHYVISVDCLVGNGRDYDQIQKAQFLLFKKSDGLDEVVYRSGDKVTLGFLHVLNPKRRAISSSQVKSKQVNYQ